MYILYLIILMISTIEACGQFCLKKSYIEKNNDYYLIGVVSYMLISYLLLKTYKYQGVGYCNLLWSAISIIFACVTGKIFFGEKINYAACFFVLLAVYLMNTQ
jgi:multidrug transporter EmrE-like cation transporter